MGKTLTENADFSGFTGKKEVFFEKVVHEAFIKVDEEGGTARGATSMVAQHSAGMKDFLCDRPFVFIIYDFAERQALFMGTFREPKPT